MVPVALRNQPSSGATRTLPPICTMKTSAVRRPICAREWSFWSDYSAHVVYAVMVVW